MLEWEEGWCGLRKVLYQDESLGIFLMRMTNAPMHYHKKSDETYVILGGKGKMKVGDRDLEVSKGVSVHIPTNTPHELHSDDEVLALVISQPLVTIEDHFTL